MKKLTERIFVDGYGRRYRMKWTDFREVKTVFGDTVVLPFKLERIYLEETK